MHYAQVTNVLKLHLIEIVDTYSHVGRSDIHMGLVKNFPSSWRHSITFYKFRSSARTPRNPCIWSRSSKFEFSASSPVLRRYIANSACSASAPSIPSLFCSPASPRFLLTRVLRITPLASIMAVVSSSSSRTRVRAAGFLERASLTETTLGWSKD